MRVFRLALTVAATLVVPGGAAWAMPIKTQMMKPRAFFHEVEGGLYEPLDLKSRTLTFGKAEFDQCGLNLMREASTMNYSCVLPIPVEARISRLQNVVTPKTMEVEFGNTKRKVFISVAADARRLTVMTGFDATGIDFEVSKFNDDFFKIYDKVAQLIIAEALRKQPIRIEVLESRDSVEKETPPFGKKIQAAVKAGS